MSEPAPNSQLLRSLGRLARGLSALFWGLPAALLVCAETARAEWLKPLGLLPALAVNALLLYGLWLMGSFQKQERPWRNALDRAQLLGLVNLGLSPFIYWHNKMPEQFFFTAGVLLLALSAVLFLFNLNLVLNRLGAMLPDETLRQETRQFTALNRWLLVVLLLFVGAYATLVQIHRPPPGFDALFGWFERGSYWLLVFFALLPLAMTMALLWKTKGVILDSVFGPRQ
jgi:hypothetical protein